MKEFKAIKADIRKGYESECGPGDYEAISERDADMCMEAHSQKIDLVGYCIGGYCCEGTDLDEARRDLIEQAREAREYSASQIERTTEESECLAGLCDHYTCTEGVSLNNWEKRHV